MKNKLIFRILGALASSLIIASVFVPFVNVIGYSPSLWETYEVTNSLYLPIMIIVFGAIGVIFFALNVKTEFAYMSVGAIAFFAIMQTIDILEQGVFSTLSIGYYFLVIGAFLTGIMAFLTNLKMKKKVQVVEEIKKEETSMLDQIDKLYNEQANTQNEISPIQPIDNVVQPLPTQPLESVIPIQPVEPIVIEQTVQEIPSDSVTEEGVTQNIEVLQETVVEQVKVETQQLPINPVLQEFNVPIVEETRTQETVVDQQPVLETTVSQSINPVLQEFGVTSTPSVEENKIVLEQSINPVLQEFSISNSPTIEQQSVLNQESTTVPLSNVNETVQEFNNTGFTQTPQQTSNELDIFGQPINKS